MSHWIKLTWNAHDFGGRPWIAKVVSWPKGNRPLFEWGEAFRDPKRSGTWQVQISADSGDVIRTGRRLYSDATWSSFTQELQWVGVNKDGTVCWLTEADARQWCDRSPNLQMTPLDYKKIIDGLLEDVELKDGVIDKLQADLSILKSRLTVDDYISTLLLKGPPCSQL